MEVKDYLFVQLFQIKENHELGMWLLYGTIVILSIIAFKLGFSQKLSILKSILVYIFLILGSTVLTLLALFLPITESLAVTVLVLVIYRIRRKFAGKKDVAA